MQNPSSKERHARIHLGRHLHAVVVLGGGATFTPPPATSIRAPSATLPAPLSAAPPTSRSTPGWTITLPSRTIRFKPTMENVMDGSMTYDKNCAFCHGSLKEPISPMRNEFLSARAAADDPHTRRSRRQSVLCDQVRHPLHRHARLGWRAVSDDDIWKTVVFIKNSAR